MMFKKKSIRREMIEIGIILGIAALLYFTGLHTEVLGGVQRLFLKVGLNDAQTEVIEEGQDRVTYDFKLATLEGEHINFEIFKGKTVFFNIWATWCPPCIAEMPSIVKLHKEMGNDVAFVMIAFDKDFEKAKEFNKRKGYNLPIYALGSNLPEAFKSSAFLLIFPTAPTKPSIASFFCEITLIFI